MGPELLAALPAWAPYAAAGVSALSQIAGQRGVEKRQRQLSEAMRQYGLVKAGEQEAATKGYMDTITPEARAAQMEATQGNVRRSIEQTVAEAVKAQPAGPDFGGRVSADYARSRSAGVEDTTAKIKRAIEQLAVGATTGQMATDDDLRLSRAATQMNAAGSASRNVGDQYMSAIQTVRPNSTLKTIGQLSGALAMLGFANPATAASGGAAKVGNLTGSVGLKMPAGPSLGLRL